VVLKEERVGGLGATPPRTNPFSIARRYKTKDSECELS
jgi:hypothetical protein